MGTFNDYQREESQRYQAGDDVRCVILSAEETTSKSSGKPMLTLSIGLNNSSVKINHYIVKNDHFNRNMTDFFDSFDIEDGNFSLLTWPGALGAAKLGEDEKGYLKVRWFINKKRAASLPEWKGDKPERNTVTDFQEVDDDGDMPF